MAFLGMRGTGDWQTDDRPKNYRQGILYLYPNGSAPLTGLLSKMPEESLDDPEFNWWTKTLPVQGGPVVDTYTDSLLTAVYTSGGVAGDVLYVKTNDATASEFRIGHQALLRVTTNLDVDVNAKVINVARAGANSYLACKLLENDDNGGVANLSTCDAVLIIGNVNPEGGPIPDAIAYDPTKLYNKTQIFRNPLEITRTARKTKLRTEDAYKEAKREALELHSIEMEKAFLFGVMSEFIGANGQPERTTAGLIPTIKQYAPANVSNFTTDTDFAGDEWLASGEEWLDLILEQIFRYGSMEKMAFAGSGVILAINKLVKANGQINLTPETTDYGLKVVNWITPFGNVYIKTHPLFSYDATTRNAMVIFEPTDLKYRFIDDTMFLGMDTTKVSPSHERFDGTKEEYLTECGLEFHHPTKAGFLTGFGMKNNLP